MTIHRRVKKSEPVEVPAYDTHKGNIVLRLPLGSGKDGTRYDFAFGYRKALAILDHLEHIQAFVDRHEQGGERWGIDK